MDEIFNKVKRVFCSPFVNQSAAWNVVMDFFEEYDSQNPMSHEILDYMIQELGGVNRHFGVYTLLFVACFQSHEEVVFDLLKKGADPNASTVNGSLPLCLTVDLSHFKDIDENFIIKKKEKNLHDLLMFGVDLSKIPPHVMKKKNSLLLLKTIEKRMDILNGSQREEWKKLRLHTLSC